MKKTGGCADRIKDVDKHLFFDKVKFLGIDSCLNEIPKNDLVDDIKLWPSVTFADVLPHRNAGRLHWGKAVSIQLCDFRVGQVTLQVLKRNSGNDSHDATSPSFFLQPASDFCPSPFLTRVSAWGYHHWKIVD